MQPSVQNIPAQHSHIPGENIRSLLAALLMWKSITDISIYINDYQKIIRRKLADYLELL